MRILTLRIHRPWTESFDDVAGRLALHKARAAMLKEMVEDLDLEVVDWGETNSDYPREIVEVVVSVASALIAEAISAYFRRWWAQRRVKDIEVAAPVSNPTATQPSYTFTLIDLQDSQALGTYLWSCTKPATQIETDGGLDDRCP